MDKENVVYAYMEYYKTCETKEILQYETTWRNTEDIMLSFSNGYSSTQLKLLFVKVINNFHNPKSVNPVFPTYLNYQQHISQYITHFSFMIVLQLYSKIIHTWISSY